ncbi:hypothetical protein GKG38_14295 [Gordonibacter urolithinfaciens]|uniref:4-hydroxy-3-methylbut-2-enyl diphosphate reductase n=2 Tax=Gordonibacter TaxID=644652 RepID=A0A7K0IDN4_9ACTN|nr:hypothetical protein [Gordonibacter urolithinfaciens]
MPALLFPASSFVAPTSIGESVGPCFPRSLEVVPPLHYRRPKPACAAACPRTRHIESPDEIDPAWLAGCGAVGVTAGASTPEGQIDAVAAFLEAL